MDLEDIRTEVSSTLMQSLVERNMQNHGQYIEYMETLKEEKHVSKNYDRILIKNIQTSPLIYLF